MGKSGPRHAGASGQASAWRVVQSLLGASSGRCAPLSGGAEAKVPPGRAGAWQDRREDDEGPAAGAAPGEGAPGTGWAGYGPSLCDRSLAAREESARGKYGRWGINEGARRACGKGARCRLGQG
jgi:hypothetical protein